MKFDVVGESCKKTMVNVNGMETNGMILYFILSNSWPRAKREVMI